MCGNAFWIVVKGCFFCCAHTDRLAGICSHECTNHLAASLSLVPQPFEVRGTETEKGLVIGSRLAIILSSVLELRLIFFVFKIN